MESEDYYWTPDERLRPWPEFSLSSTISKTTDVTVLKDLQYYIYPSFEEKLSQLSGLSSLQKLKNN